MDAQTLPIVPFGKHKGKPITTLLNDNEYLEWCKRSGALNKYPIIYNICVNQTITTTNQNSKTPEHNKLQNLFLDKGNQIKLLNILLGNVGTKIKQQFEALILDQDFIHCFGKIGIPEINWSWSLNGSKIVFEDKYNWDFILYYEDYRYERFDTKYDIKDLSANFVPKDDDPKCERDPKLRYLYNILGKYGYKYNSRPTINTSELLIRKNEDNNSYNAEIVVKGMDYNICCELKPILSDDYPCVLRKMKTQIELTRTDKNLKGAKRYMLIIGRFTSEQTTKDQLIAIFKQSNIVIIFTDEIFDNLQSETMGQQLEQIQDIIQPKRDKMLELEEENKTLTDTLLETQEKLLQTEEKIKQLEEEIQSLKTQKQSKSITDYFGKK
jgi:CO dehydrogenase/acetyl-CoA synthase epsilon subunit